MIQMYEPKVKKLEERYFANSTMNFIRTYIRDFNITGKLFRQGRTLDALYEEARRRLFLAGLNAGIFRVTGYKTQKIVSKGKVKTRRVPIYEGKPPSTHLLKHTFVSLASLHGFGLNDVAEQTGTDPSILKKYYLGVGKQKLKAVILGEYDFVPWNKWIDEILVPHYRKRYAQLKPLMKTVNGLKLKQQNLNPQSFLFFYSFLKIDVRFEIS